MVAAGPLVCQMVGDVENSELKNAEEPDTGQRVRGEQWKTGLSPSAVC